MSCTAQARQSALVAFETAQQQSRAHFCTSKKWSALPLPSFRAEVPVSTSRWSGLKQQFVSEWLVGKSLKVCSAALSLRVSQSCKQQELV